MGNERRTERWVCEGFTELKRGVGGVRYRTPDGETKAFARKIGGAPGGIYEVEIEYEMVMNPPAYTGERVPEAVAIKTASEAREVAWKLGRAGNVDKATDILADSLLPLREHYRKLIVL